MTGRDYIRALSAELRRAHISDYEVRRVGRTGHPRLFYRHNGRERFIVFPASPSDSRYGVRNAVGFLRRQLAGQ